MGFSWGGAALPVLEKAQVLFVVAGVGYPAALWQLTVGLRDLGGGADTSGPLRAWNRGVAGALALGALALAPAAAGAAARRSLCDVAELAQPHAVVLLLLAVALTLLPAEVLLARLGGRRVAFAHWFPRWLAVGYAWLCAHHGWYSTCALLYAGQLHLLGAAALYAHWGWGVPSARLARAAVAAECAAVAAVLLAADRVCEAREPWFVTWGGVAICGVRLAGTLGRGSGTGGGVASVSASASASVSASAAGGGVVSASAAGAGGGVVSVATADKKRRRRQKAKAKAKAKAKSKDE